MTVVGRTYLERGEPVVVLAKWREWSRAAIQEVDEKTAEQLHLNIEARLGTTRTGPRNVLIRRKDGTLVIRPFRGLRKAAVHDGPASAQEDV